MRLSDHRYGRLAEAMAAWALRFRGYRIVGRNVRVAGREVDLVARRGGLLVICEVKARSSNSHGHPLEAVTAAKQVRLRRLATLFLRSQDEYFDHLRFDVATATRHALHILESAF